MYRVLPPITLRCLLSLFSFSQSVYLSFSLTFLVSFSFLTFHFTFESANTITATCPSFPFSLLLLFLHFFLFFSYLSSSLPFVTSSRGLASSCVTSVATEIFRRPVSPFAFRGAGWTPSPRHISPTCTLSRRRSLVGRLVEPRPAAETCHSSPPKVKVRHVQLFQTFKCKANELWQACVCVCACVVLVAAEGKSCKVCLSWERTRGLWTA